MTLAGTVILDRDGVINEDSDDYIKHPDEWIPIPGSLAAIAALHQAGYRICVATNQSGLSRGLYTLQTLAAIHDKLHQAVLREGGRIAWIAHCPHLPEHQCDCRKPKIGLLEQINAVHPLNADTDWMIGDSATDLEAAQSFGIRAALVESGKGTRELAAGRVSRETTPVFRDLAGFTQWLLG